MATSHRLNKTVAPLRASGATDCLRSQPPSHGRARGLGSGKAYGQAAQRAHGEKAESLRLRSPFQPRPSAVTILPRVSAAIAFKRVGSRAPPPAIAQCVRRAGKAGRQRERRAVGQRRGPVGGAETVGLTIAELLWSSDLGGFLAK